ncbi:Flp pilus assembly protein TadG [Lipingzhangella halophila]|uniref:Flp pilus assembly protein TadG n=1 Tax=Lipingzhangella halophila TaxID=1783352 RepID=A0A7W7RMN2_9ACTN|nr:TadE/TadG family type IV pilus assembly protein [Lipingzhangella halophila]MBB4934403.1 Flp pilus assembly protein TadG [Lipingzhangella halophila]
MTGVRRDRGAAPVELVMIAPSVMVVALVMVFAARQVSAQMSVDAVAHAAARSATLHTDEASAQAAASDTVEDSLAGHGLACVDVDLALQLEGLRPGSTVTATLTCTTDTSDLAVVGPSRHIRGSATAIIDRYRGHP